MSVMSEVQPHSLPHSSKIFMKLIVQGGATKTVGALSNSEGQVLSKYTVGPTNLHVVGVGGVYKNIKKLLGFFKKNPAEYHFYLSGLKSKKDKTKMKYICKKLGLKGRIILGHDLLGDLLRESNNGTGIIVVSGTGSAVYGRNKEDKEAQVGGMGEKLGDEGSAYNIAIEGMRAAIRSYDGRGPKTTLEKNFGRVDELIDWIEGKPKTQIAELAPIVFKAAEKGDGVAEDIIDNAVNSLIEAVTVVRKKIGDLKIYLSGGNFEHQPMFKQKFVQKLDMFKVAPCTLMMSEVQPHSLQPHSLVMRMNEGDRDVVSAVARERDNIVKAIEKVVNAFRNGGRLFYVGAGTSGRIAMMDAVECPSTFCVPKNMVQAIVAGGKRALIRSVEGAEDDYNGGRQAIRDKEVNRKDVVIGVSASGKTPFVIGALREAKRRGAYTTIVSPDTGPEIIEGSTRLKAGTAEKMILNMISTISMIKLGKTFGNLMINVRPKSEKLVKRAVGIISSICDMPEKKSLQLLKNSNYNTRKAVRMSLWEKVGELLMFGFDKDKVPKDVGSVIIFKRNVKYLNKFDKKLFIAVDQEGGRVNMITKDVTILPAPKDIKNTEQAYKCGEILAKELKHFGIKMDFAPVVDVNTEPKNPIIGDRSFGDDPKMVSRLACAMIRGMHGNGLLACAKHFPGHGATKRDSHKCLPKVDISYEEWEKIHLLPFKNAIKTGVSCIMVGHILCPALDKEMPSSLSYKIITGILREKLGFEGVIITDDLGMGAITNHFPPEEAAVLAINAGVDIVLACRKIAVQKRIRNAIVDAILDGRISIKRINESVERILKLKKIGL